MRKIILFLSLWSASLFAADYPMIIDPVVNATPPGAKVTAGYLTLVNETEKDITITGVYSPSVSQVEIHLSSVKNDVASMEKQDTVNIKAGDTLEFTHGSYHLMLMQLTEPLEENDSVDIILMTSIGEMLIEMPVRKAGMKKDEHADMNKDQSSSVVKDVKDEQSVDKSDEPKDMKKDGDAHTEKTKVVK